MKAILTNIWRASAGKYFNQSICTSLMAVLIGCNGSTEPGQGNSAQTSGGTATSTVTSDSGGGAGGAAGTVTAVGTVDAASCTGLPTAASFDLDSGVRLSACPLPGDGGAQNIQTVSSSCSSSRPDSLSAAPPPGQQILLEIAVYLIAQSGTVEELPAMNSLGDCGSSPSGGYYLDDSANPTVITLCPCSCSRHQEIGGSIDYFWRNGHGCAPQV
jgi:hypothetical protein